MVEIRSPFPDYALPRVWSWLDKVRNRVADDFGPRTVDEWVDQELSGKTCKTWGVYRDGELGGMISFQKLSPWLGTAHCTFRKDFWGRATTRPALREAFSEIFGSGIGKLTFLVFADNQAVRSLLADLGATLEGTFKAHTVRNGEPVSMKAFGLTKEGFDAALSNWASDATGERNRGRSLNRGERPIQPGETAVPVPGDAGASG